MDEAECLINLVYSFSWTSAILIIKPVGYSYSFSLGTWENFSFSFGRVAFSFSHMALMSLLLIISLLEVGGVQNAYRKSR